MSENKTAENKKNQQSDNILEVSHLKKYFPIKGGMFGKQVGAVKAVDDVSFTLKRGTTMGLVGESGCGKSTTGRTILRLIEKTDGQVLFNGKDVYGLSNKEMRDMRTKMQIIFQDPYSSLSPRLPVGEIIGEAVREHNLVPKSEYADYVTKIMDDCGLQSYHKDRYPHEFSGGQRQRICIARALALNPEFVVCDEPVSALDVSVQAQIINLLKELQEKRNLTYLFISHDLSVVEHISDTIGVMYLGGLVETGTTADIFANPLHPYTEALFSAIPMPDPDLKRNRIILEGNIPSPANPPKGCKFHTRCRKCMEICKTQVPEVKDMGNGHKVRCHLYDYMLCRPGISWPVNFLCFLSGGSIMGKRKKEELPDYTVANMDVDGMPWNSRRPWQILPGDPSKSRKEFDVKVPEPGMENEMPDDLSAFRNPPMTKEERRGMIWLSLKASLTVGLIFGGAAFLFILFCVFVWLK